MPSPRYVPAAQPARLPPACDGAVTQPLHRHSLHHRNWKSHEPQAENVSSFGLQPCPTNRSLADVDQAAASQSRWLMVKRGQSRTLPAESLA